LAKICKKVAFSLLFWLFKKQLKMTLFSVSLKLIYELEIQRSVENFKQQMMAMIARILDMNGITDGVESAAKL
jgi:hypothetical protein